MKYVLLSLEMLDKVEAPTIPDGYGISVAYACLLDVVHSISVYMDNLKKQSENGDVKLEDLNLNEKETN